MCTAITYLSSDFYFGRTLDYHFSFGEEIAITPRSFEFKFKNADNLTSHYAIIGTAHVAENYPLYYDALNEKGLCIAGLNFPENACYNDLKYGFDNIAQFELIPWLLGNCASVKEVKKSLQKINITNTAFNLNFAPAQLHWLIADKNEAITVEATKSGLNIYNNPVGVLTNNPPFPLQLFQLNNYMSLSPFPANNNFSNKLNLNQYCLGMGAIGLPGDWSSQSRFIRAAFVKQNSIIEYSNEKSVNQFFHILSSAVQAKGCSILKSGEYEYTIYTSCMNADRGIYYYKTYDCNQINAVQMHNENLDGDELYRYPMIASEKINMQS